MADSCGGIDGEWQASTAILTVKIALWRSERLGCLWESLYRSACNCILTAGLRCEDTALRFAVPLRPCSWRNCAVGATLVGGLAESGSGFAVVWSAG